MDIHPFRYMTWAKAHYFDAEYCLVPSGIAWPGPDDLDPPDVPPFEEVGCDGPGTIQDQVARAYGTPRDRVLCCLGSTQANHHLFAALLGPGDEVLVEEPAYELFRCLASVQGIACRPFPRRPEASFDLEPDLLAAAIGPRTRLVALTSVHNPTGRLASVDSLRAVGEVCDRRGIHCLVSEVYLDFVDGTTCGPNGEPPVRPFAHRIHPRLVSTNSVTKVYGLGSARIGWLMAEPDLVARCAAVREILCPLLPALPVAVATAALARRHHLLGRARRIARTGRAGLTSFFASAAGFDLVPPQAGIMSFVRVHGVDDTTAFTDWLRAERGVGAVPGEHFRAPGYLRLGYGGPPDHLRTALARLAEGRRTYLGRG